MQRTEIILVVLIVLTSGCMDEFDDVIEPSSSEGEVGEGFTIEEFSISDEELREDQFATLTLEATNYNDELNFTGLTTEYNEERLEITDRQCNPPMDEIGGAREDYQPSITCTWDVTTDLDGDITLPGGELTESITLRKEYETAVENQEPISIDFRDQEDIRNTHIERRSFSNSEVKIDLAVEEPASLESGTVLEVQASETGNGRIDGDYSFDYRPEEIIDDCPESEEPLVDDEVEFTCTLSSEVTGSRNLVVSTEYKYVEEPVVDVRVVER